MTSQIFAGVLRKKRQAGKRKRLGGFRLPTPHAPSGVCTQPSVEKLLKSVRTLQARAANVNRASIERALLLKWKSRSRTLLLPRTAVACRISATPEHLSYCEVNPLNSVRNDLYLCPGKREHGRGAVAEPGTAVTRLQQRNQWNDRAA